MNSDHLQREEAPYFRDCQKLGGMAQKDIYLSPTKAATYLHLLNHCDRNTALQFAKRRICKWDTTIEQDGPASCRILIPEQKREVKVFINQKCLNGWQNIGYEIFYQNKDTIADQKQLHLDYENDKIQKELEKNEQKLTNDVKLKMKNMAKFYQELNQKYHMNVNDPDFKEQVQRAKELLMRQRNKPLQYFKKNGVKFVELLHELKLADQRSNTLLDRFRAFKQLKASQFRIKEKLPERLYNRSSNEEDTPSHRKKLYTMKKSFKFLGHTSKNLGEDSVKMRYQLKEKSYHISKQFDNPSLNVIQLQSQTSLSQHKKTRTSMDNEEYFEQQLGKLANRMIEYHPLVNQEIQTENIAKLKEVNAKFIQNKASVKQLCLKKINKLETQSQHRSKTERQESINALFTSRSRDKDSTKASIIYKRSQQLLNSFTNKSDYVK